MWPNARLTQIWPFGFILFISMIGVLTAISQGIIEKILTSKFFMTLSIYTYPEIQSLLSNKKLRDSKQKHYPRYLYKMKVLCSNIHLACFSTAVGLFVFNWKRAAILTLYIACTFTKLFSFYLYHNN